MRISDWSSDVCSSDLTAFTEYKLTRGMLDYDDILIYFAALLEDETIGKLIRQRWSHVMVDEYQDTNAIQLEIVYGLAGEQENIFIVGDPSQSIYGFRGSAPSTRPEENTSELKSIMRLSYAVF